MKRTSKKERYLSMADSITISSGATDNERGRERMSCRCNYQCLTELSCVMGGGGTTTVQPTHSYVPSKLEFERAVRFHLLRTPTIRYFEVAKKLNMYIGSQYAFIFGSTSAQ